MRVYQFNHQNLFIGKITTNDLLTFALDNNFIDIQFTRTDDILSRINNIILKCGTIEISHPISKSKLYSEYPGTYFNLEWLKYFAMEGQKSLNIEVYFDTMKMHTFEYRLIDGRNEVEFNSPKITIGGLEVYRNQYFIPCPTQLTKHNTTAEFIVATDKAIIFSENMIGDATDYAVGVNQIEVNNFAVIYIDNHNNAYEGYLPYNLQSRECADIELRITNRHGLRGVIGGKLIDVSEGGDDVKSNFNKVTPYAGIYEWSKKGATIKKEVGFNFEGDEGLLSLLRDGCVYGRVEWYDERTGQWLPCRIEEKSIGNNAWDEQIVTIVLQEL
jgi:hypothetical protein